MNDPIPLLECRMSRMNSPSPMSGARVNDVYTGLAFISMIVTLAALVYVVYRFMDLGVFK
jgi:hypothetical protein